MRKILRIVVGAIILGAVGGCSLPRVIVGKRISLAVFVDTDKFLNELSNTGHVKWKREAPDLSEENMKLFKKHCATGVNKDNDTMGICIRGRELWVFSIYAIQTNQSDEVKLNPEFALDNPKMSTARETGKRHRMLIEEIISKLESDGIKSEPKEFEILSYSDFSWLKDSN